MTETKASYKTKPLVPQSEADFRDAVIEFARARGWLVHHCRAARRQSGGWSTPIQGDAGFPDLVLCRGEIILFVELKGIDSSSKRGELSREQKQWMAALRETEAHQNLNMVAVWWPDSDWQEELT